VQVHFGVVDEFFAKAEDDSVEGGPSADKFEEFQALDGQQPRDSRDVAPMNAEAIADVVIVEFAHTKTPWVN
jgi:hypothetical protein